MNRRIQKDLTAVLMDSMRRKDEAEAGPSNEEDSLLENLGDIDEDFDLLDRDDHLDSDETVDQAIGDSVESMAEVGPDPDLDVDDEADTVIDLKEEVETDLAFDEDEEIVSSLGLNEEVDSDLTMDEPEPVEPDLALDDDEPPDLTFTVDVNGPDHMDLSLDDDDMDDLDFALDEDEETALEDQQALPAADEAAVPDELILEVDPPGELELGAEISDNQDAALAESMPEMDKTHTPAPPQTAADDALSRHLKELFTIGGYRASAILDAGGEILASDTTGAETELDLEYTAAMFSNVFQGTRKICEKTGFEDSSEMSIVSTNGIIVMRGEFQESLLAFVIILILEPEGNQALARMSIKRMLPRIKEALK